MPLHPWKSLQDLADRVFVGYANLVARRPLVIGAVGVVLAVALSLGLLVTKVEKRDLNALWIDLDSRVVEERRLYEEAFGGLTRKLTCAVSPASADGSLFSDTDTKFRTDNALEALKDSMQVWANTTVTADGRVHTNRDMCERAQVPVPFRKGQSTSGMYWRFSQCMASDINFNVMYQGMRAIYPRLSARYTPLPSEWSVDEFPCSRASALDCFKEGEEVDWPTPMRQLDQVAGALLTASRQTKGQLFAQLGVAQIAPGTTVSFILKNGATFPCWLLSHNASLACLGLPQPHASLQLAVEDGLSALQRLLPLLDSTFAVNINSKLDGAKLQIQASTAFIQVQGIASAIKAELLPPLKGAAATNANAGALYAYLDLGYEFQRSPQSVNASLSASCMTKAAMGHLNTNQSSALVSAGVAQLYQATQFLGTLGYWWRPSFRSLTNYEILEHFNMAANTEIDPAARSDPTACLTGKNRCCVAWNGAFIGVGLTMAGRTASAGTQVPNTGLSSKKFTSITAIRSAWEDYNENNPLWTDELTAAYPGVEWTGSRREDLTRAFDKELNDRWRKLYSRAKGSKYGQGEVYESFRLDFGSGNSFTDILEEASEVDGVLLSISYGAMSWLITLSMGNFLQVLLNCGDKVQMQRAMVNSHAFLGQSGLLVIALSSVAGIGFASYVQIVFNPLTINLVPFVSLGLGVDDMFVMAHAMVVVGDRSRDIAENMRAVMRTAGPSVCLTSVANACAFILIYYVPVSAVRQLVLVLMISVLANLVFLFLIFVPLMVLEFKRLRANRMDMFFIKVATAEDGETPGGKPRQSLAARFIDEVYAPLLSKPAVKAAVLCAFAGFFAWSLYSGIENTQQGLRVSDVALRDTYQRDLAELTEKQITTQSISMMSIARGYSYGDPRGQARLMRALDEMEGNPWRLRGMRMHDTNYLTNGSASLLSTYASAQAAGALFTCPPANVSTPIPVPTCYDLYFPQWYAGIGLAYANFLHCVDEDQKRVSCLTPGAVLNIVRTNYNFNNLYTHDDHLAAITDVRARTDPLSDDKMQIYSIGYVFYFWEQYFGIVTTVVAAIGLGLLGVFVITFIFQLNPWLSSIVCLIILMIDIELIGLMDPIGTKLNAISIANLVVSIGMAVEFTAHYARAFLLAPGNRNERMKVALHEMLQPMVQGALSTIIALAVLSMNKFPFFRLYYAITYVVMVVVAFANGLILMPVILSMIGPRTQAERSDDYQEQRDSQGSGGEDVELSTRSEQEKEEKEEKEVGAGMAPPTVAEQFLY